MTMRTASLFLPLFFVLPILISGLYAQEAGDDPVKKLRIQFEKEIEILSKPLKELNAKYRKYLDKQKAAYQEEGDLDGLLAVDTELKTFESEPSKRLSSFPELKRLQEIYRKQLAQHNAKTTEPKLKLIRSFKEEAEKLSKELTKAGKIEEAKLARVESERFAEMEQAPNILSSTSSNKRPDKDRIIQAAVEKFPGRLYCFGSTVSGPISVSNGAEFNDFTQVRVVGAEGWFALRKNGEVCVHGTSNFTGFSDRIEQLGSGANHGGVGLFAINSRNELRMARSRIELDKGQFRKIVDVCSSWSSNEPAGSFLLGLTESGKLLLGGKRHTMPGATPVPESAKSEIKAIAISGSSFCHVAKLDGSVVSWKVGGSRIQSPGFVRDVVKIAASGGQCMALTSEGEVLVWTISGEQLEVPSDLGKCIAIRSGGKLNAAQRVDGSWVAWGSLDNFGVIDKINSLGPVTDLTLFGGTNHGYALWIKADLH